ncbi:hypothetical protein P3339_13315 [Microbulbifer sp. MLAF003]|uniref:hypothetical protein n=1 Tax=Microbulbifer TaxID=48073 RepID=UPI000368DA37|nr:MULTISPECIES: hypothetical protein [Microbulbifer]WHI49450.1 hypothetical protein P3339_13315 [Microbulbifer sp. MLAF003]
MDKYLKFDNILTRLVACVTLLFSPLLSAEELSTYSEFPKGSKTEVIPFPIEFASDITLNGIEELVFLPGMYKQEKEDFFSYAFSWTHKPEKNQVIGKTKIENFIASYYRGLYKAVTEGKEYEPAITIEQVDGKYTGQISWIEPFVTKKEQTLHFKGDQIHCEKINELRWFFLVSPQDSSHPVWKELQSIKPSDC